MATPPSEWLFRWLDSYFGSWTTISQAILQADCPFFCRLNGIFASADRYNNFDPDPP